MELLQTTTIITRTGFCNDCFVNHHPKSGQQFKVVGSRGAHMKKLDFNPRFTGFTPHLYHMHKAIGNGDIIFDSICCIVGCGIVRVNNDDEQCWEYIEKKSKWIRGIMNVKDWNYLVACYKRDLDYFL